MGWNKLGKPYRGYYNVDDVGVFGANAIDYTLTTGQGAKLQACVDQVAALGGGTLFIGGRIYVDQEIVLPSVSAFVRLLGAGSGPDYQHAAAALIFTTDLGSGKFAIRAGLGGYPFLVEHLTIAGPGAAVTVPWGGSPALMSGVYAATQGVVQNCRIYGFHSGIWVINDHQKFAENDLQGNGFGMNWGDNGLGGLGDQIVQHSYMTNNTKSSIGVADTNTIANCRFVGNGHCGLSPFGIYRYSTGIGRSLAATGSAASATLTGVAAVGFTPLATMAVTGTNIQASTTILSVSGTSGNYSIVLDKTPTGTVTAVTISGPRTTVLAGITFENWSWEGCHHTVFYDELSAAGWQHGGWSDLEFDHYAVASTFGWHRWEQVGVAATGSGASATITGVAVTNFTPTVPMIVTGTNIPANTTVLAVSGSSGNYSLTLSATPTGTVSTVTVGMPLNLGIFDVGDCSYWTVVGPPLAEFNTHPWLSARTISGLRVTNAANFLTGHFNSPGSRPLKIKQAYSAFAQYVQGCFAGDARGTGGLSMTWAQADEAIAKWDVVEMVGTANCRKWRGSASSHKPAIALDDFAQGEIVSMALDANSTYVRVKNVSGSTIAQNALVKPSTANPGYVVTATGPTDGPVLGRLNDTSLVNNGDAPILLSV